MEHMAEGQEKNRGTPQVCVVVVSPRVGQPELDVGVGDRLALFGSQHCPESSYPLPTLVRTGAPGS